MSDAGGELANNLDAPFVDVATFLRPVEAKVVRVRLDSREIACRLEEVWVTTDESTSEPARGLRLSVPEGHADAAIQLIEHYLKGDASYLQFPSDASNEAVRLQGQWNDEHQAASQPRCPTCAGRDFSVGTGVKWYGILVAVLIIGPGIISRSSANWFFDILYFSLPVVILGGIGFGLLRMFRLFPLGCEECGISAGQRLLRNSAHLLVLLGSLLLGGMLLYVWWGTGPIEVELTVPLDAEKVERSESFWDVGLERLPHLYFEAADSPEGFHDAVSDGQDDIDFALIPTIDLKINEVTFAVRLLPWDSLGTQDEVEASLEPHEVAFACSKSSYDVFCVPHGRYPPSMAHEKLRLRPFQNNRVAVSVRDIRNELHGSRLTVQMAVHPERSAVMALPLVGLSSFFMWILLMVAGWIWWAIVDSWLVRRGEAGTHDDRTR